MYRLPGERIRLDLDGPTVEVEPLRSWMLQAECLLLAQKAVAAAEGAPQYVALNDLYEYVIREAQPQWDIVDHIGAVPLTARGMARLPLPLAMEICNQWLETLDAKPEPVEVPEGLHLVESDAHSAVDAKIPPGPVNRELKRRLNRAKAA